VKCEIYTRFNELTDLNKENIMKNLPIASAVIVSLIFVFATNAIFFASSANFTAPAASKAGHHNSVAGHHAKFI
jgi:hypothetical protein